MVGSYGAGLTFVLSRFPEPDETVFGESFRVDAGGKGSNQAIGAARLGAHVDFLTAIGDDAFAEQARELWLLEHIRAVAITVEGATTMVGGILVDARGENRIVVVPGALGALTPHHVEAFEDQITRADICLVSLEIPLETAREALVVARRNRVRTILNPAPASRAALSGDILELADYLTPNRTEAQALIGEGLEVADLAIELRARSGATVTVTLGAEGALLANENGTVLIPAVPVATVVDTTGAGDAFNAALAVALGHGCTDVEAVQRGCLAGGWMVREAGVIPGLPTSADLERWPPTSSAEVVS